MNHKQFLASLDASQHQALTATSDAAGLKQLFVHTAAIAGCGCLIAVRVPLWPVLLLPQGILVIFLFCLLHETAHGTAFKRQWLNHLVARITGFAVIVPQTWFRFFHFAHHRHTQVPDKDPELATPRPATPWQYIAHASGVPVWISQVRALLMNAAGRVDLTYVPARAADSVKREARATLVLYGGIGAAMILGPLSELLYLWLLPLMIGQPFLRLFLLAEHGQCRFSANMFDNTRTTFTNRLVRRLTWNMSYHAEHHAWPGVPFHKLPALHGLTAPHLTETADGYVRFNTGFLAALPRRAGDMPDAG